MSLLLDTNVLLRLSIDSSDISETFKEEVDSGLAGGGIAVSTVTFVETTRLHRHGRIDLGCHPAVWRRERLRSGLREIPVSADVAVESVLLMSTGFHRDPADQLIVATAMPAGMRLATTDEKIIGWARRSRLLALAYPTAKARSQSVHEDVNHWSM